ncbi:MAG: DUF58 domain-containing protein [Candidatus Nanopelagicales bacterium]
MTGRAIGAFIAVPVVSLLAFLLGYPGVGYAAFGIIVLIAVAGLLVAKPPTSNLDRSVDPAHVTRGESATVRLGRRNRSPVPAAPLEATDRIGHLDVHVTIPLAAPATRSEASYRFVTTKRGHLTIGPAVLTRRDPWGLFQRSRQVGEAGELLVYPRVLPMGPPDILARLGRDAGAADVAAGSDRFHTLREYVVGDELRKIHWPSSARTGVLVVKQMVDSPRPRLLVFLDCETSTYPTEDSFEQAVDATASLANAIAGTGVPMTVVAGQNHAEVEVTRPDDLAKLLETLAVVDGESQPMSSAKLRGRVISTRATAIVAVTGPGTGFLSALTGVRSIIGEAALYRLGSPAPPAVSRRRGLVVVDAATAEDVSHLQPVPVKRTRRPGS